MRLIETNQIGETILVKLWSNEVNEFFAEIYLNGSLWDHKEFVSLADAKAFTVDPLADDRAREKHATARAEALDAEWSLYRASCAERISRGRHIKGKPGAA